MKKLLISSLMLSTLFLAVQAQAATKSEKCTATNETQIKGLFDRWNKSLATGNPAEVVKNYAPNSVLLATLSNEPRDTPEEKAEYFTHFLEKKPQGVIDTRNIYLDCNTAVDAGTYTFTLGNGTVVPARYTFTYKYFGKKMGWLITSHHSSAMPEKVAAAAH
jgi:uncharacterized protein (TIGR02246 family)